MDIIIAIIGALLKAIFGAIGDAMASSNKSEAEAAKHTTKSVVESYEAERTIRDRAERVKHVDLDPTDIFGARSASPIQ